MSTELRHIAAKLHTPEVSCSSFDRQGSCRVARLIRKHRLSEELPALAAELAIVCDELTSDSLLSIGCT
jgi:hypothetical protein